MMETVLDIKGLTVSLPENADRAYAIEDIALQVKAGEIVCVVGESGSGKSVMSFAVMGLQDKSALKTVAGEILLEGRNLLDLSKAEIRKVARREDGDDLPGTDDGIEIRSSRWAGRSTNC